jgi:hypothetical protein
MSTTQFSTQLSAMQEASKIITLNFNVPIEYMMFNQWRFREFYPTHYTVIDTRNNNTICKLVVNYNKYNQFWTAEIESNHQIVTLPVRKNSLYGSEINEFTAIYDGCGYLNKYCFQPINKKTPDREILYCEKTQKDCNITNCPKLDR